MNNNCVLAEYNIGLAVMTFPMKEHLFGATITNELATLTGLLMNQTMTVVMKIVV